VLQAHLDIFIITYLNNILIYLENSKDHVEHVKTVLKCLNKAHLQVKLEKCKFYKQEVEFLSFIVET
jgi:hypothetical protein